MPNQKAATKKKPLTKAQLFSAIADKTGGTKAEVAAVFDAFTAVLRKELGRNSPGALNIPTLLKISKVKKPARKAQKGVPNPFKPGETMDVAARPAHNVVKVRPLKGLKDMV
jgi:nucleoid DNA-binding protein